MSMMDDSMDQGRDQTNASAMNYEPTDEEKRAMKLGDKCYSEAKSYKRRFDYTWLDDYRMFRGKQWKEDRPSYRHSEVINLIFQSIQSEVPLMTDSRPKMEYLPQDPSDRPFSDIINKVCESDWQTGNWLYKLTEVIYDSHIYGTGISGMYEPEEVGGRINYRVRDPFYAFPDPDSLTVNEGGNYYCYAEPVTLSKLKREYPDKAQYLKADLTDNDIKGDFDASDGTYKSTINDRTIVNIPGMSNTKTPPKCLKKTLYIKDETYLEEEIDKKDGEGKPMVGPDGQPMKEYQQRLKYPQGRKICWAADVLLDDAPIAYDDGKFPDSKLANYIVPREFWGISDIEQGKSPQKIYNKLLSFSLDVLTLMGNPIWKVPTSAGIDTDNLVNRPGLVLEYEGDQAPTREEGVQLQPYVLQLMDRIKNNYDDVQGSSDVSRGAGADGITAASAIQALQEASKTRVRLKGRNLDAHLQDLGQSYLSRVMQFYTAPQVFRITNDQNANQYFKFYIDNRPDQATGQMRRFAVIRDYNDQGQEGPAQEHELKGNLDVRIITGSTLPFGKQENVKLATDAFDRGIIDGEEWLKQVDYPNWEAVNARVQERKAQMAAQAPQGAPAQASAQG